MDDRTTKLLLKAVRKLPEREQDQLLAALLRAAVVEPEPTFTQAAPSPPRDVLMWSRPGVAPPPIEMAGPTAMLPVRLPPELHERLRTWSGEHGFSMASVIRGLVERFLDEQERRTKPPRRAAPKGKRATSTRRRPTARG